MARCSTHQPLHVGAAKRSPWHATAAMTHRVLATLSSLGTGLSRRRGFLVLTLAVLGLGLGATLTVLEIADALFWRPLPYPGEDRLVFVSQLESRGSRLTVTGADFLSWKAEAEPF